MSKTATITREEWLNKAADRLNTMIAEKTDLTPAKGILVSVGWPRNERGGKVIGICHARTGGSGVNHVFVTPRLATATDVLPVLLHELVHAADDCANHHTGPFVTAIRALGLEGKPTATVPGKALKAELRTLAGELGPYPHKRLSPLDLPKTQSTRMLKVECGRCGCIVRMTKKWLEEVGEPTCGCGGAMEWDHAGEGKSS